MFSKIPVRTQNSLIAAILNEWWISVDTPIWGSTEVGNIIDRINIKSSTILSLRTSTSRVELYRNILRVFFRPAKHDRPQIFLKDVENIFLWLKWWKISKRHYTQIHSSLLDASKKTFLRYIWEEKHEYLTAVISWEAELFVYPNKLVFTKKWIQYTLSMDWDFASVKVSEGV